jgi:hypothetical protein
MKNKLFFSILLLVSCTHVLAETDQEESISFEQEANNFDQKIDDITEKTKAKLEEVLENQEKSFEETLKKLVKTVDAAIEEIKTQEQESNQHVKNLEEKIDKTVNHLTEFIETTTKSTQKSDDHACKQFGNGKWSGSARLITDMALWAAADTKNISQTTSFGIKALPFFHLLMHDETQNLHGSWSWLSNNWTTMGLIGAIYAFAQKQNWTDEKTIKYITAAIYGQGAVAITAAQAQEMELI